MEGASPTTAIDLTADDPSPPRQLQLPLPAFGPILLPIRRARARDERSPAPSPSPPPPPERRPPPDEPQLTRRQHKAAARAGGQPNGPELGGPSRHGDLGAWKERVFQELRLHGEYAAALEAVRRFQVTSIQTLVPNRYRRPIENLQLPPSLPDAFTYEIAEPMRAIRDVYEEHTIAKQDPTKLVLYTDASGGNTTSGCGLAIVYRQTLPHGGGWSPWTMSGYKVRGQSTPTNLLEGIAFIKALDKAIEITKATPNLLESVVVYTDAQSVMQQLGGRRYWDLRDYVVTKVNQLCALGPSLSLRWSPSHSKVPGNEIADRIAGLANRHDYQGLAEVVDLSDDDVDVKDEDVKDGYGDV
ncbi:hypothetical protein BDV95DRAFT_611436 [Massariosphaeria phaeospora]|uniref:RNase H type-1 domain-containing protein n=1 Tax=Massariosphaeria phaeospora TaxID=100035 RepID=A0A7C8M3S3_9PLEO|nr:hypothetical protein BDV95DRAFT_611436 [Massariosphaeria phaeospora]